MGNQGARWSRKKQNPGRRGKVKQKSRAIVVSKGLAMSTSLFSVLCLPPFVVK